MPALVARASRHDRLSTCVGDVVRITEQVSPRYLVGLHGTVISLDDRAASVRLERRGGRFEDARVRCPPLTLEKLPSWFRRRPSPVIVAERIVDDDLPGL